MSSHCWQAASAGCLIAPARLEASTLSYTLDSGFSTITGSLNGTSFSNATFTITATADPTSVQSGTFGGVIPYNQLIVTPTMSLFSSGIEFASFSLLPTLSRSWAVQSFDQSLFEQGNGAVNFGLDISIGDKQPYGFGLSGQGFFNSLQSVASYSETPSVPDSFSVGAPYATSVGDLDITGQYSESVASFTISSGPSPVPEIDPTGMGSVLALVTGALGLLERRRLKVKLA